MKIHVMKFGGSSLGTPEKICQAAAKASEKKKNGIFPVMVVSAPADITDDLIKLASQTAAQIPPREYDALLSCGEQMSAALCASALCSSGNAAMSVTGWQAGILTDSSFKEAGVISVSGEIIKDAVSKNIIPVIAGFQGSDNKGNITTLGRGGSDLTAVLVAQLLEADLCEFYTDVKGIYSAHPALVPEAEVIPLVSYGEILALGAKGTAVRQIRAIRYAMEHGLSLRLRSSFLSDEGTVLAAKGRQGINALALQKNKNGAAVISAIGYNLSEQDYSFFMSAAKDCGAAAAYKEKDCFSLEIPEKEAENALRFMHSRIISNGWQKNGLQKD